MKNVLEVINLANSARNFIGTQFSYLQENGDYRMHLICSPDDKMDAYAKQINIAYHPLKLNRQLSTVADIKTLVQICKYIRKNNIEVVIAHQAKARLLAMLACFLTRVPYRVIFAHGVLYETMHGMKRWLVKMNDRFVSSLADKVICVSHFVADTREKDHIDKNGKRVILGQGSCNGIDAINKFNPTLYSEDKITTLKSKYGISNEDFVIGFVGRLVRDKGVVELLDGFVQLQKKYPEKKIKLMVIGNPETRDALPDETMAIIKKSKDIIFTGAVPYEDIAAYYMLMDVFVLPSHRDGLGMVALEAAAMERPVLVSSITGCRETILPNVTGCYIDLTGESICNKLEKYLDKKICVSQGHNARKFVLESFERSIVNKEMLDFLNDLIEDGK